MLVFPVREKKKKQHAPMAPKSVMFSNESSPLERQLPPLVFKCKLYNMLTQKKYNHSVPKQGIVGASLTGPLSILGK